MSSTPDDVGFRVSGLRYHSATFRTLSRCAASLLVSGALLACGGASEGEGSDDETGQTPGDPTQGDAQGASSGTPSSPILNDPGNADDEPDTGAADSQKDSDSAGNDRSDTEADAEGGEANAEAEAQAENGTATAQGCAQSSSSNGQDQASGSSSANTDKTDAGSAASTPGAIPTQNCGTGRGTDDDDDDDDDGGGDVPRSEPK
jgi:hypothetical protein